MSSRSASSAFLVLLSKSLPMTDISLALVDCGSAPNSQARRQPSPLGSTRMTVR